VSNVFHRCPQVQNHLSLLRGDQPQSGQRMLGGFESSGFFSSSSSRSSTAEDVVEPSGRAHMPSIMG
jgi:hypothetical protein